MGNKLYGRSLELSEQTLLSERFRKGVKSSSLLKWSTSCQNWQSLNGHDKQQQQQQQQRLQMRDLTNTYISKLFFGYFLARLCPNNLCSSVWALSLLNYAYAAFVFSSIARLQSAEPSLSRYMLYKGRYVLWSILTLLARSEWAGGWRGATRTLLACTSACVLQVQPQNVAQLEFTGFRTEVFYTFLAAQHI